MSQKPSLNDMEAEFKKYIKPISGGAKKPAPSSMPKYSGGEKKKFSAVVQKYLTQINPSFQLDALNDIQKDTPFLIIDPIRPREVSNIVYGMHDLINFLNRKINTESSEGFYEPVNFTKEALVMNKILASQQKVSPMNSAALALNLIKQLKDAKLSDTAMHKHPFYALISRIYESLSSPPKHLPVYTKTGERREKAYLNLVKEFYERSSGTLPVAGRNKAFIGKYFDTGADIDHMPKSGKKHIKIEI